MDSEYIAAANKKLNEQLLNAQFDRFVVSSIEICLCFISESLPKRELWLTTSGRVSMVSGTNTNDSFFEQRGTFLSQVYPLIGNSIKQVEVDEQGQLSVVLGNQSITVLSDEENLEEIWSVTPDDYSQFKEYEWFVTYTDNNELLTK